MACAPGIMPYLVSKRYDKRKCLQLSIIFNIPRIIALTIFGVIIGIVAYLLTQEYFESSVKPAIMNIQVIGYGALGIFILAFGVHMFLTSIEKKEDLKECKNTKATCNQECKATNDKEPVCTPQKQRGLFNRFQNRFDKLQDKPNKLFFIWGGILSLACLGESILIELSVVSGSIGILSNSLMGAAFFGGAGMFFFGVGAAIPIIIVAVTSSSVSKYIKTIERLESIRTIGAMVMIMLGLVFIIMMLSFIVSSF